MLASIDRFWKVPGIVHIVCHPDIMTRASTELDLKNHRHMVMVETYWVPSDRLIGMKGWWIQQLIKLQAPAALAGATEFYMTMDADSFLVRDVKFEDLIVDGKAIYWQFEHPSAHEAWFKGSREVLGDCPDVKTRGSVTNSLLSKTIVKEVQHRLRGTISYPRMTEFPWYDSLYQRVVNGSASWSEYAMYHLVAHTEYQGPFPKILFPKFHVPAKHPLVGNSVWHYPELAKWQPEKSFRDRDSDFLFSVIQSNTSVPAPWVWERVKPYLL